MLLNSTPLALRLRTSRAWLARNLVLLALPVVLVLSVLGARALADQETRPGFTLLCAAAVLLLITAPRLPAVPITEPYRAGFAPGLRRGAGALCLLAGVYWAARSASLFAAFKANEVPGPEPWNQFVLGVGLWVLGGVLLTTARRTWTFRPVVLGLLLLITGLAIALRLYHFDSQPLGVWIDEGIAGLDGRLVLHDGSFRPFFRPITNITGLHQFIYAGALKLFGEANVHGLRAVSVIFGVGSAVLAYAVGDQLHGPWFGLLMAFFMATMHWSINFSRIAMTGIETGFFTLLTFYFVTRLARYGRLRDALWVGLSIGAGLWFYAAYRLILVALAIYGVAAWRFWRPVPILLTLSAILASVVIAVYPLGLFAEIDPDLFTYRTNQVSILREENRAGQPLGEVLRLNTEKHLLMFHVRGDTNGRHNLPGDPMLDPVTGVVFVLGMGLALRRLRHPESWFFLLLLVVGLLNGILTLSNEAPQALRSIGVIPAVAYFSTLAVVTIGRSLYARRALRLVLIVGCAALCGAVFAFNAIKYFDRQAHDPESWISYSTAETLVAKMALARGSDHQFYVTPLLHEHPSTLFLTPHIPTWPILTLPDALPVRVPATEPVTLFIDESEGKTFEYAQRIYPDAYAHAVRASDYGRGRSSDDPLLFYLVDLTPSDLASVQGLNAEGEGVLYAPQYTSYRFWTSGADVPLSIDGQPVATGQSIVLAQGNHALSVDPAGLPLDWEIESYAAREPIPDWALYHAPVSYHGLHGYFYPNADWAGSPALERIDPILDTYFHHIPLSRPYSVVWKGWLDVPQTGEYGLGLQANTSADLLIDAAPVLSVSVYGSDAGQTHLTLTAGLHPLEVRYLDATGYSGIYLTWSVAGGDYVPIPTEALLPFVPGAASP